MFTNLLRFVLRNVCKAGMVFKVGTLNFCHSNTGQMVCEIMSSRFFLLEGINKL